jgi:hypothetical protein
MSDIAASRNAGTVDSLLHDAGFDDDALLRETLQDLRGLASGQPEPSAAVAALMVPAGGLSVDQAVDQVLVQVLDQAESPTAIQTSVQPAATRHLAAVPAATRQLAAVPAFTELIPQPGRTGEAEPTPKNEPTTPTAAHAPATDELAARRRAKRRITFTTLSVAVSLAAGGAVAVASDQGLRDSLGQVNQAVSSFVATVGGGPAPVPVESPAPLPALPAQPGDPATLPAAPAVTPPVPSAPGSGSSQAPQDAAGQSGPAPAVPLPDLSVPRDLTPGLPGVPDGPPNGEGQPPALPLPASPPVPLPGIQP